MFGKENKQTKTNPVHNFYDWKSDKENKTGTFKWRNKETKEEVAHMPKQFILLLQTSCVKWWDEKSQSKIYSNEVVSTKNEDIVVKSFKGGTLYEWKYNKDAINALGADFTKGIIVLEGTEMNEYYLKGGALFQRNEDINIIDTQNYYVKFDKIEQRKRGAVTYYIPRFVKGDKITDEDRSVAMEMVTFIEDYRSEDE